MSPRCWFTVLQQEQTDPEASISSVLLVRTVCSVWFHWPFNKTSRFSFCLSSSCTPPSHPTPPPSTSCLPECHSSSHASGHWQKEQKLAFHSSIYLLAPPEPVSKTKNSNTTLKNTPEDERSMSRGSFSQAPGRIDKWEWKSPIPNLEVILPGIPRGVAFAKPCGRSTVESSYTNTSMENYKGIQVPGLLRSSRLSTKTKLFSLTFWIREPQFCSSIYPSMKRHYSK